MFGPDWPELNHRPAVEAGEGVSSASSTGLRRKGIVSQEKSGCITRRSGYGDGFGAGKNKGS